MPLPELTARERLALDLEHTTENLWTLVSRELPTANADGNPTAGELAGLVDVLRRLDAIGVNLAPDLYRPAEKRRGQLED